MMKRAHLCVLASTLLGVSGCPTRDKYERSPSVRITTPSTDLTFTNRAISITAVVDPPLDLPSVVRKDDGVQIGLLPSGTGSVEWNTTGVPEGPHVIVA